MFIINAVDRVYDLHRPKGCSTLTIAVDHWPGNEFCLWLPETVFLNQGFTDDGLDSDATQIPWCNWGDDARQVWQRDGGRLVWEKDLGAFTITSTLTPDPQQSCIWFTHRFCNVSAEDLFGLNTQNCFHLVNAPQFISIQGERIWACLDRGWTTTDKVPRGASPDPRRVMFLREGARKGRSVVPSKGFPYGIMSEQASHGLIIAENFQGTASVGIAFREYRNLFNNNDCMLRCVHSDGTPIGRLPAQETKTQEGVLLFCDGDHQAALEQFDRVSKGRWA